jgi:AcrR family transcriptional regulator
MEARGLRARERILEAAYELFSHHGIRAVGIDAIIERSGVARMSLYNNFASKDELVLAFLQRREERWTKEWLQQEVEQRASDPRQRLLALFDVLDEWFQRSDFEGCAFIRVLLETPQKEHALHVASTECLARIRAFVAQLAAEAGLPEPDAFARQWQILMKGSIIAASEGDRSAARRAKEMAGVFLRMRAPAARGDDEPPGSRRRRAARR